MKLEDIDKKNIFEVPDRYFDTLPMKVQERLPQKIRIFRMPALKYAAAALVPTTLVILLFVFPGVLRNGTVEDGAEAILAQIDSKDVMAYIELTDITTEDILENIDPSLVDFTIDAEDALLPEDLEFDDSTMESIIEHYGLGAASYENI